MSEEQISALVEYVRSAIRSAVAESRDRDDWAHDRLERAEQELISCLKDKP